MSKCDLETGVCRAPEADADERPYPVAEGRTRAVHYVGDPMCSWCWGLAPVLQELAEYCAGHGIAFTVTVGGLRAGGGDLWNPSFKAFLRHEWQTIERITGQPFGFSLLELERFDYDTEPACRAVVTMADLLDARPGDGRLLLNFFASIQRKFYVDGADPKVLDFYRELCPAVGVPFARFSAAFQSEASRRHTLAQFEQCRRWGVRGFPSILVDDGGRIGVLASGYLDRSSLMAKLQVWLAATPEQ